LEMSVDKCLEVVKRNKDKILSNVLDFLKFKGLAYKEIFVYKSRVAGTCRENSDIDIYIQLDEKHKDLVEREGNVWSGSKGLDPRLVLNWGKEMKDMELVVIEKVYGEQYPDRWWSIELDIRMGLDPQPPCPERYKDIKYYMKLAEVS